MPMKKYSESEGKLEVLRGHEAVALDRMEARFGKRMQDFNDDERKSLHDELDKARKQNEEDAKAESFADSSSS
jgi:hypothetical protein